MKCIVFVGENGSFAKVQQYQQFMKVTKNSTFQKIEAFEILLMAYCSAIYVPTSVHINTHMIQNHSKIW